MPNLRLSGPCLRAPPKLMSGHEWTSSQEDSLADSRCPRSNTTRDLVIGSVTPGYHHDGGRQRATTARTAVLCLALGLKELGH
jgi:hypothetical protein